jgi:hypothetical protein
LVILLLSPSYILRERGQTNWQQVNEDKDYAKDKEYALHILSLIVSFVRHAETDLLGLKSRKRVEPGVSL